MRYVHSIIFTSFLLFVLVASYTQADQVIYVGIWQYDPALSQFGVEVKGNTWTQTIEDGALSGTAFGAPGDNNHGSDGGEPYLVMKLPVDVKAGESTSDGKTWAGWARLYEPESIITADGFNSFFLRTSTDAQNWTPATRGDTALRWNDPGAMFPDSINNVDLLFTSVGDRLPWFWQKHTANGQSTIDPVLEVGVNYIEVGIRESDAVKYPRIEVVCLRNDDQLPSDDEVPQYLTPVKPGDKLSATWGKVKSAY
jgi:hypothetical protein